MENHMHHIRIAKRYDYFTWQIAETTRYAVSNLVLISQLSME